MEAGITGVQLAETIQSALDDSLIPPAKEVKRSKHRGGVYAHAQDRVEIANHRVVDWWCIHGKDVAGRWMGESPNTAVIIGVHEKEMANE